MSKSMEMQSVLQAERDIESINTQVIIQTYSDRVLVIITQLKKVGTLIQASLPPTTPLVDSSEESSQAASDAIALSPVHPSIDLVYLFGHAPSLDHQTLYSSYAAQVATLVWASERYGSSRTPVIVGVALKALRSPEKFSNADRATFLQVMDLVRELLGIAGVA
ncbi:hypothetical protein B0F90DRAFT_1923291 [Multifurca ochricompacta]|uniref:Proteasome assembly chaperone 3 n=1 Tax=Multifurca ochricompacta TaxID=376703 RepID=A0AAD4MAH3_9AGAM|nr:hypothetical protein B0F90DRAFT_1923291 [Multifurca ochricompacta]